MATVDELKAQVADLEATCDRLRAELGQLRKPLRSGAWPCECGARVDPWRIRCDSCNRWKQVNPEGSPNE